MIFQLRSVQLISLQGLLSTSSAVRGKTRTWPAAEYHQATSAWYQYSQTAGSLY